MNISGSQVSDGFHGLHQAAFRRKIVPIMYPHPKSHSTCLFNRLTQRRIPRATNLNQISPARSHLKNTLSQLSRSYGPGFQTIVSADYSSTAHDCHQILKGISCNTKLMLEHGFHHEPLFHSERYPAYHPGGAVPTLALRQVQESPCRASGHTLSGGDCHLPILS